MPVMSVVLGWSFHMVKVVYPWYAWSIGQSLFDCLDELHAEDKCYCMHFIFRFWSDLRLEQNMRQKTLFWFVRIQLRSQK